MPDSKQSKLEKDIKQQGSATEADGSPVGKIKYSRPLLILRRPAVRYTDTARERNISGTVRFHVTFLADGHVGPIKLISAVDRSLAYNAFDAAKKIKFIPAEIGGQKVDVTKMIEYSFTIY